MTGPRRVIVTTETVLEVTGPAPANVVGSVFFHARPGAREVHVRGTTGRVIGSNLVGAREQEQPS